MIPETFSDWQVCITRDCKLELSPEFAAERFAILSNPEHPETVRFIALYGEIHRQKVCSWFAKVAGGAEVR